MTATGSFVVTTPRNVTPRTPLYRTPRSTPRTIAPQPGSFGGDSHIDPDVVFSSMQWVPTTPPCTARVDVISKQAQNLESSYGDGHGHMTPRMPQTVCKDAMSFPKVEGPKNEEMSDEDSQAFYIIDVDCCQNGEDTNAFSMDDFYRGVCVKGVDAEDSNMYPAIVQLANKTYVTRFMLMGVFSPVLMNSAWMMLGNIVNDGEGLQNLYYFVFFFDSYFMLLKGTMISAYFAVFMPPSSVKRKLWVHIVLVCLFPLSSVAIHFLWVALDTVHTEDNWVLMKLNFPAGASLSLVGFMPLYLWVSFAAGERFFAFKRYFILVIVLVADLFFIATSHIYVFYFFEYQKGKLMGIPESWLAQRFVELLWVSTFSLVYMPLLGKIWQFAFFLFDMFAPMRDLQRQRLFCFATVILDMHRIMYVREIFTGLKGYEVFALVVLKDWIVDVFQFGFRSLQAVCAGHLALLGSKPKARSPSQRLHSNSTLSSHMTTLAFVAELLESPLFFFHRFRQLLGVFHWRMHGCYDGPAELLSEKSIRFFFCDGVVYLSGLPSIGEIDDDEQYSRRLSELANDWKGRVLSSATKSAPEEPPRKRFQIFEKPDISVKEGSKWDKCHAFAFATLPCKSGEVKKIVNKRIADEQIIDFYRPITMQITGLIYTRWKIRGVIRLSSALMFLFTGFLIRLSPSSDVMNKIMDHSGSMPVRLWIFGTVFVITDLVKERLIMACQNSDHITTMFNMRHFARLFSDQVYFGMILSCLVCCNSDVFLTFPDLRFGD